MANTTQHISVNPELWASRMLPEGILEHWFALDNTYVQTGQLLAQVSIEDALHDIFSPGKGRLSIATAINGLVEPGTVIGSVVYGGDLSRL